MHSHAAMGATLPMCGHPLRRGRWCRGTADRQWRSKMTATLKMTHKAIGVEVRRGTYHIVVDGQRAGSLEMNDTIEIPVEPGRHPANSQWQKLQPNSYLRGRREPDRRLPMHRKELSADLSRVLRRPKPGAPAPPSSR